MNKERKKEIIVGILYIIASILAFPCIFLGGIFAVIFVGISGICGGIGLIKICGDNNDCNPYNGQPWAH